MMSLVVTPAAQRRRDGDRHGLEPAQRQGLGGQHVLHLGGADAEGERAERAVGRGVAVAADDGHARLGQPELRADDVHDALLGVAHRVQPDAELRAVAPQGLDLGPGHRVGDRQLDVDGGHVVVLGGQREVGPAHRPAGQTQPVERLRAGHLVDQVQVDVEQVGLALAAVHHVPSQTFSASVRPTTLLRLRSGFLADFSHMRDASIAAWDSLAASGCWTRPSTCSGPRPPSPCGLAELCTRTGLPRATAHRLAVGLEAHGLLRRGADGRWCPGPTLAELAAGGADPLLDAAAAVLPRLRDLTGESVQLYRRDGLDRVCVAAAEPASGLRDTVPVGARLPMTAGSGAKVLAAWAEPAISARSWPTRCSPSGSLVEVRRRGWAQSVGRAGGRGRQCLRAGARRRRRGDRRGLGVRPGGPDRPAARRRWAADLLAAADALTQPTLTPSRKPERPLGECAPRARTISDDLEQARPPSSDGSQAATAMATPRAARANRRPSKRSRVHLGRGNVARAAARPPVSVGPELSRVLRIHRPDDPSQGWRHDRGRPHLLGEVCRISACDTHPVRLCRNVHDLH